MKLNHKAISAQGVCFSILRLAKIGYSVLGYHHSPPMTEHLFMCSSYVFHFEGLKMLWEPSLKL
jgi:hypothetical protein